MWKKLCSRRSHFSRRSSRQIRSVLGPASVVRRAERLEDRRLLTVDLIFDYRYADHALFTTQTFEVFAEIEQLLESRLTDTLAPWSGTSLTFRNPETAEVSTVTQAINANEVRIFVGARNIDGEGGTLALGSSSFSHSYQRDASGDHSTWGGSIALDTSENWHINLQTLPAGELSDMYSTVLHEVGHILGIGVSSSSGVTTWDRQVDEANVVFEGPASRAVWNGDVPLASDLSHFANNEFGPIGRESVYDLRTSRGVRKTMSPLDWAALQDMGWDVNAATEIQLRVDQTTLGESGDTQTTATVTRVGGLTNSAETVFLSVTQNADELTIPATVVIPDGVRSVTFPVQTVNDEQVDGDQSATIEAMSLRAENVTAEVTVLVQDDDVALADLAAGAFDIPTNANAGDQPTLQWSVNNTGDSDVDAFDVRLYLGLGPDADPENDLLLAEEAVDGLGVAETRSVSTTVTLPAAGDAFYPGSGRYFLRTVVDAGNVIDESNEANNVVSEEFNIGGIDRPPNLDVDGDRVFQPLSDGILTLRFLGGFSGDVLTVNAVSSLAVRHNPAGVTSWLAGLREAGHLDVDGDGGFRPLTDGILILRFLANFTGNSLINGAVAPNATRSTADEIVSFLTPLVGQGSGGAAAGADAMKSASPTTSGVGFAPDEDEIDTLFAVR